MLASQEYHLGSSYVIYMLRPHPRPISDNLWDLPWSPMGILTFNQVENP